MNYSENIHLITIIKNKYANIPFFPLQHCLFIYVMKIERFVWFQNHNRSRFQIIVIRHCTNKRFYWFSKRFKDVYEINLKELLSSGRFGQVYGGISRANNKPVAIKVIDKVRFTDFKAETNIFQSGIRLLFNIDHPGLYFF